MKKHLVHYTLPSEIITEHVCILALYQVQCGHIFLLRLSAALNTLQPLPIVFSVLPSYAAFFSSDNGGCKISDGWLFHLTGSGLTSSFSVMPSVIANWQQSCFCLLSAWHLPLETVSSRNAQEHHWWRGKIVTRRVSLRSRWERCQGQGRASPWSRQDCCQCQVSENEVRLLPGEGVTEEEEEHSFPYFFN